MTKVIFVENGLGLEGFTCQGHAGYAAAGEDIVCAAVSILTTTCANALETVAGVSPKITAREKDAYLALRLPQGLPPEKQHDAQILLLALRQGLEDLQEAYPKYIHLTKQERRK